MNKLKNALKAAAYVTIAVLFFFIAAMIIPIFFVALIALIGWSTYRILNELDSAASTPETSEKHHDKQTDQHFNNTVADINKGRNNKT